MSRNRVPAILVAVLACFTNTGSRAAECDDLIARHMIGQAMLAAQFVAVAEKAGMTPAQINGVLNTVTGSSAIEEFWITDSAGHAYLTNTGIDFTFSPDPAKPPPFGRCSMDGIRLLLRTPGSVSLMTAYSRTLASLAWTASDRSGRRQREEPALQVRRTQKQRGPEVGICIGELEMHARP
jgi:hypothetical protein